METMLSPGTHSKHCGHDSWHFDGAVNIDRSDPKLETESILTLMLQAVCHKKNNFVGAKSQPYRQLRAIVSKIDAMLKIETRAALEGSHCHDSPNRVLCTAVIAH
jgi:hypothetical protein